MLYKHFSEEMLGLQDFEITKIEQTEAQTKVFGNMKRKQCKCPRCASTRNAVHDYRSQTIKDIPSFGRNLYIILRKRRYKCKECGKRYFEENNFLPKYYRITNRLSAFVIDKLRDERSFTSVARDVNLSLSGVIRIFDIVSYPKPKLQEALSIYEFKGNTWGEKYQCI
ncbi:MAG: transposase family protein, partial [Oscillospiraceae bacterium]